MASSGSSSACSLGLEIISINGRFAPDMMTAYTYINEELNHLAFLWEFRSELSYSSFGNTTAWHGSWTEDKHGRILLKFHFDGDIQKLKSTTLVNVGNGVFSGFDYKGRGVRLERRAQYVLTSQGTWRQL